ncbi:MAG: radical SAM protein [Thermodesulfovibrionales bacterium]
MITFEGSSNKRKEYPGCLRPGFEPFEPLDLASWTEEIVCKDSMRKYTDFYCTGVYGGISTGYAIGCCLRCIFCWVDFSREFPEKSGRFYSTDGAFEELLRNAKKKNIKKMRISGGEPTLCQGHLLGLLNLISGTDYLFILETNGILFGADEGYVEKLTKYKNIHVRVSLKAGTPEGFQRRTGSIGDFYELPYNAIRYLMKAKVPFHVAAMSDQRLMSSEEKIAMLNKLNKIGYKDYLEEEVCDPYPHTIQRLKKAGMMIF